MDIVLKELALNSSEFRESALMYWILQNPDLGLELKMNLLNLEMRRFYFQKIQEAQNTLLVKCEEKKQTFPIIEEDPKRPSSYDLKEQKLKPIHKARVSEGQIFQEIPVSQENNKSFSKKQRNEMSRQSSMRRWKRQIFELQRWALSDFIRRYECCRQFTNFPEFLSGSHSLVTRRIL